MKLLFEKLFDYLQEERQKVLRNEYQIFSVSPRKTKSDTERLFL
jgi:hypothetical protein